MDYASGVWSNDAFGDRGWLAIALVIFTLWKPNIAIFGSIIFGGLYIMHLFIPGGNGAKEFLQDASLPCNYCTDIYKRAQEKRGSAA